MGRKISISKRIRVFNKTAGECSYCGGLLSLENYVIDHVHPKARGGNNHIDNLLPSCAICNASKCAKSLEQFRRMSAFREVYPTNIFNQKQVDYIFDNGLAEKIGVDMDFIFHFENMELNHETI